MTHTYKITGMTCSGCQHKVQQLLSAVPGVSKADIDLQSGTASIGMTTHIPTAILKQALAAHPKYQLSEQEVTMPVDDTETKTFWETYKPILLVFAFITGITLLAGLHTGFDRMSLMNHFMAGFFFVFSFFKLLDLRGFAENYAGYDIIARRWQGWGYVYAFVELGLAIAYFTRWNPVITNTATFVVMSVSIIGVLQSVFAKRKIRCACLGAVFNLPMSTVTILEDAIMIVMSALMLISIF